MPLTDAKIRNAKPAEKPYKLADERGLYLLIQPSGAKLWRFKYRIDGKEKLLAFGSYPALTLTAARDKRDEARTEIAQGIDPSAARKARKAARAEQDVNTLEVITREWFTRNSPTWAPSHADRIIRRFERDVFPWIGTRPIAEITAQELLRVARRIEARGSLETAHRALQTCGQVFRYAVATGRAERDPTGDLRGALPPAREAHFPAVTDPAKIGKLLRTLDGYEGTLTVRCALRLAGFRPPVLRVASCRNDRNGPFSRPEPSLFSVWPAGRRRCSSCKSNNFRAVVHCQPSPAVISATRQRASLVLTSRQLI